ncbi:hypothetical protein [Hymenobacter nivis]|uniref:Uncharacterized protein n=1 Tax=Hymenobacter nivis TaxID=1850093 RepID=A0A502H240_9BACT|nr:hypothetical protein [Hymenobacter nivis]TPG67498.1 hypothetical protein EAH73_07235 [Hymenobacter nivis]
MNDALWLQARRHPLALLFFLLYAGAWVGVARLVDGPVFDGNLPGWPVVLGALASLLYGFRLLVLAVLDDGARQLFTALLVLVVLVPVVALAVVA